MRRRLDRREGSRGFSWYKGKGKKNERRWRCKSYPTNFIETWGSVLPEKHRCVGLNSNEFCCDFTVTLPVYDFTDLFPSAAISKTIPKALKCRKITLTRSYTLLDTLMRQLRELSDIKSVCQLIHILQNIGFCQSTKAID
ncbi:hypothetical protein TNCV_2872901 [Trichonephila clavipes]|nr:hypothetical protein TNCV_2872901 [Trichonephila clavipes]